MLPSVCNVIAIRRGSKAGWTKQAIMWSNWVVRVRVGWLLVMVGWLLVMYSHFCIVMTISLVFALELWLNYRARSTG